MDRSWLPSRQFAALTIVIGAVVAACGGGKLVLTDSAGGAGGEGGTGGSAAACPEGLSDCDGACLDTRFDPENCGGCGKACAEGEVCSAGTCGLVCGGGTVKCADGMGQARCVDTTTSESDCGECGKACGPGETCVAGKCELGCGAGGAVVCGNVCTNLQFDPQNCGGCGMVCPVGVNTVPLCAGGKCGLLCMESFGDCNFSMGDGCETNLLSSTLHCNGCGKACVVQNGTAVCDAGTCKVATCNPGWGNCDNDNTSCETNTTADVKNCGACGKACLPGESCVNSKCEAMPPSCRKVGGLKWCTNPNQQAGLNCNQTCASVGSTPIDDNNEWFNAQDTFAECQAIRDAFGLAQAVSIASYTYACAEALPNTWLCSNYTGCPQQHRTSADGGSHVSYCPCK